VFGLSCTALLSACRDCPIQPTASWPSIMDSISLASAWPLCTPGQGYMSHICHLWTTTRPRAPRRTVCAGGVEGPGQRQIHNIHLRIRVKAHSFEHTTTVDGWTASVGLIQVPNGGNRLRWGGAGLRLSSPKYICENSMNEPHVF